jgi:hypothetical protein
MSDTIHIHIERECPVRVITVEPTGARGAAGTSATVAVGTTTTLAPGSSATVVNAGTSSAAVFNFGIPTGATGATGASGGSTTAWRYRAKTNATSGYPGNGYLLWNNATQLSATNILVSHLDDEGTDVELLLSFFAQDQKIFIQNRDDSSQNQVWEITGTPTVTGANTSTAYYTFPVTLVSSAGGEFNNNHSILFGSIAAAVNAVTSATTSDGTASLNISNLTLSQAITSGLQTKMTFTANPTTVGDGQQIIWQWYNGGSPITTAAITTEATGSTSDKLLFKTSYGGSVGTSLDLTYTVATFSGSISSLGESYRSTSTFTYAAGVAATHRTALGLTTLATTTPAANVATFLETPSSANLAAAVTDETGSGSLVFGTSPTLTTPTIAAINGGTAANDDITIQGTTNATRTTSYVNLQPNGGLVGIGTATPSQQLDVSGNINVPTTTSTVGVYMINGTRFAHNYGTSNTFIGTGAGNTSFNTLYNGANVAVGTNALSSLNGTSSNQGSFNFGLGSGAGSGITTGSSNILIGNSVGTSITTTSFNTVIGDAAAFGATGLTGVVYIGRGAGRGINTFTDSVFLGTVSGGTTDGGLQTVSGLTNAIAIGARSFVGASHTMALGSVGAYAVDIVSGGSVASAKLHLIKTTEQLRLGYDASNAVKFTVGASNAFTIAPLVNSTTALNYTNAGGTSVFNIDSTNSRVGIGTTSPTAALDVNSDTVRVRTARTPASATATGNAGDICWDANYIYVCTATNTWKRTLIATWV